MTKRKGEIDRSFFDDMLGDVEEASTPGQVSELPFASIKPRPEQFRRTFDDASIGALASSIKELGLLEPIVVRQLGDGFEIVAGERRYRALGQLGQERVPVRVVAMDDMQAELAGAVENLNREDLTPLEEVDAVLSVVGHVLDLSRAEAVTLITRIRTSELGNGEVVDGDHAAVTDLFKRLGYTSVNSFYANRLSLLRYPEDLLDAMRSQGLAYTKARVLARVKDESTRRALTAETLEKDISVEALEIRTRSSDKTTATSNFYDDFSRVKRYVTKARVQQLDAAKQRRLRRLLQEMEHLLSDQ